MATTGGIRREVTRDDAIAPKKRDKRIMTMIGGIRREATSDVIARRQYLKWPIVCGNTLRVEEAYDDIEIVSAAKFAVEDHNKKKTASLEFVRVLSARERLVSGMIYEIILEVTHGGKKKLYEATVWVRSWLNFMEVKSFKFLGETAVLPLELRGVGYKEESHVSVN